MDATEGGYFPTRRRAVPSLEMWRERREMTREDLARLAGVTEAQIERWEAGGEPPTLPQIRGLAEVLGVDPWELSRPPYAWQRSKAPRQR
jgi:transcriptional regulator with XRE-family HTH domain